MRIRALFLMLLFAPLAGPLGGLHAQAVIDPGMGATGHFDMTGFPQWSRDLRRASIVAFGSFPFMYLISHFAFDTYRFSVNDRDMRYAPWPFTAPGRAPHSQAERFQIIGIAAASAVFISVIDHGIERSRRNRLAREAQALAPGMPIIIRTPLHGEEAPPPDIELDPEAETL